MSHAAAASLTAPAVGVAGRGKRLTRRSANPLAHATSSSEGSSVASFSSSSSASAAAAPDVSRRRLALGSAAALVALPNVALAPAPAVAAVAAQPPVKSSFYDYTVEQYGKPFDLGAFKGDVTVVLNVASE